MHNSDFVFLLARRINKLRTFTGAFWVIRGHLSGNVYLGYGNWGSKGAWTDCAMHLGKSISVGRFKFKNRNTGCGLDASVA